MSRVLMTCLRQRDPRTVPTEAEQSRTKPNEAERCRTKPSKAAERRRTKPNEAERSRTKPNEAERSRTKPPNDAERFGSPNEEATEQRRTTPLSSCTQCCSFAENYKTPLFLQLLGPYPRPQMASEPFQSAHFGLPSPPSPSRWRQEPFGHHF